MMNGEQQYCQRVQRIIAFCEQLTLPDGAYVGQKVKLRAWQKEFINAVYGPKKENGLRRVREALLTMGRKNGKTALIAMLLLVHLCGPESIRNGQLYSVAFDREQAAIVFKYAAAMVYADEELELRLNVISSKKMIEDPTSGSVYQALSAESRTKHGKSSSFIIFDELAQFGNDRELYDTMMTSRGAHAEPLVMVISTQAASDAALLSELVDRGKKIISGEVVDPTSVAFVYEVPADADIFDEANWYLANPALGDFLNIEILREDAEKAKAMPGAEAAFRNLYMNQRVSADKPFVTVDVWKRNGGKPSMDVFESGTPCTAGLDLSSKNDLTALVFAAEDEDHKYHVLPYFWTPKSGIEERAHRDRVPYDLWEKQGYLTATPGAVVDYDYIAAFLGECHASYNITGILFDRWRVDLLKAAIIKAGIPCYIEGKDEAVSGGLRLIPHGQGFKDFGPAVDRLEDLLLEGRILHGGHPILTMCASNTRVVQDPAGNRKFDKMKSTGRIDGMVALGMAVNWTEDAAPVKEGGIFDWAGFLAAREARA
ncbi:terminase large subunit [Desulfovibrio desulfuricans]|nr:terminase large subunit [Desulfovibrio desulfuricans]